MEKINLEDLNLFYYNFFVNDGNPKIKTWVGIGKDDLETDLVTTGKFNEVTQQVLDKLNKYNKVTLIGSRGIGKSTIATYTAWRLLLDNQIDTIVYVDSLKPTDALHLNNEIEYTNKKYLIIYDPSPIMVYYEPYAMQSIRYNIKEMRSTLKELMDIRNAKIIIVLPNEMINDEPNLDINPTINVDLKDEEFLKEVIKKYSGCDNISNDLVKNVMEFNTYTLVAKYIGIWLKENECAVNNALTEGINMPKLFYANYIWGTILKKNTDLAKKVSVPLILHANFGSIPEEVTYKTKGVIKEGVWGLIDKETISKVRLQSLKEEKLEQIAKWLSIKHEDLIEETLKELVGLNGKEARKKYIEHGFRKLINALDWGYEKILEEIKESNREVNPENFKENLSIFIKERLMTDQPFS
jgi:ABC-type dipeptide/oligopeptide/nickel transport system ATPase component